MTASPVLRYCKTPGCRVWTRLDVCPHCLKTDRRTLLNVWVDRIIITGSVVGMAALGWYIAGRL